MPPDDFLDDMADAALQPRPVAVRVGRALAAAEVCLVIVLLLSEGWFRLQGKPGLAPRLRDALAATLAATANPVTPSIVDRLR